MWLLDLLKLCLVATKGKEKKKLIKVKEWIKKGKENTFPCTFGNKKKIRKEKNIINMLSYVWFVRGKDMKR